MSKRSAKKKVTKNPKTTRSKRGRKRQNIDFSFDELLIVGSFFDVSVSDPESRPLPSAVDSEFQARVLLTLDVQNVIEILESLPPVSAASIDDAAPEWMAALTDAMNESWLVEDMEAVVGEQFDYSSGTGTHDVAGWVMLNISSTTVPWSFDDLSVANNESGYDTFGAYVSVVLRISF